MKTKPFHIFATAVALFAFSANAFAAVSEQTIKNLNTAFQGESNAASSYAAFAKKADQEGFVEAAKLFRAASAAETIHRDTHKAAILELSGTIATFQLDPAIPGATSDNLRAAINGESHERDTVYPEFLTAAKADDAQAAIRAFQFALTAEKEHAKLYKQVLDTLGKNAPADYFVCRICGMTLAELPAKKCPSCHKSRDDYKKIS